MTYWNLETPPNSDDRVVMAMDWPELAEAVSHCCITFLFEANKHAVHKAYVIAKYALLTHNLLLKDQLII